MLKGFRDFVLRGNVIVGHNFNGRNTTKRGC